MISIKDIISGTVWFFQFVLGFFTGGGAKPSNDERLGQEEIKRANTEKALQELRTADNAGLAKPDPERLLNGTDPAAAEYRPGQPN